MTPEEEKRGKAHAKEVDIVDVLLENRAVKARVAEITKERDALREWQERASVFVGALNLAGASGLFPMDVEDVMKTKQLLAEVPK